MIALLASHSILSFTTKLESTRVSKVMGRVLQEAEVAKVCHASAENWHCQSVAAL